MTPARPMRYIATCNRGRSHAHPRRFDNTTDLQENTMDQAHTTRGLAATARPIASVLAAAAAALVLVACGGGSGEGLDPSGRPIGEGGGGGGPATPTFASIQAQVFTPRCTACHAGAGAPVGLRLDAGNSYAALVGVPSGEVGSLQRVAPGKPDDSYLIHKLDGRAGVGARMPLGGPFLDEPTIALVRQWIAAGAQNN
jgi:hypothetical protein